MDAGSIGEGQDTHRFARQGRNERNTKVPTRAQIRDFQTGSNSVVIHPHMEAPAPLDFGAGLCYTFLSQNGELQAMSAEEDLSLEAKAREWLDMAQTKWRLQTMQHRSRYNPKTGEYRQLPTRVRRFLNGTPVSMKARVLSILKESAPYSCPVFDLETGDAKYVPVNTYIRKDGPELTSGGADATYTIVQDLKLFDEAGDTFDMRDESSCAQVGKAEWHWDEPDVADCPYGSQGVSYQVANVSRDSETDLFSYVVRKVQALTVHVPAHVASCDEFRRVSVESWDNVYGEPGAFRWDPVRGGSAALEVPGACDRSDGTLVKVSVNRNADCTYRIEVERTDAIGGEDGILGMYFVQHDSYKSETGEKLVNAFSPLPRQGVVAENGLVTRYQSDLNEDGTWTNGTQRTQEHTVMEAVRRRTWGWIADTSGYSHRSVSASVVESLLANSAAGTSIEVKLTEGGLFDVDVQTYAVVSGKKLGFDCQKTKYQHVHESVTSASVIGDDASAAGGGKTYRRTFTRDTTTGAVTKRETVTTELSVPSSRRSVRVTARGKTVRVVDSNAASAPADASQPGRSTEYEITPGGRYNVTTETTTPASGSVEAGCAKDAFEEADSSVAMSSVRDSSHAAGGTGGVYREKTSRLGDDGLWENRTVTHTETKNVDDGVEVSVTARGTRRTVKRRNASKPAEPSAVGSALRTSRTRGGLYNVETTTTVPNPGDSAKDCSKDLFSHTHTVGRTASSADGSEVAATVLGSGVYRERRQRLGDDGLWGIEDIEHTELPVYGQRVESRRTRHGMETRTTNSQMASDTGGGNVGHVVEKTRGGRYNVTAIDVSGGGTVQRECAKDAFLHSHTEVGCAGSPFSGDVENAAGGEYRELVSTLSDDGVWETRTVDHREIQQSLKSVSYKDAFGTRTVMLTTNGENKESSSNFSAESLIKSVEQEMTRGRMFTSRVTEEKPQEVNSGWLSFKKVTDNGKGLAVFYDFIVFRNAKMSTVRGYITHIANINYRGGIGSYANHPSISISPNRFKLWDGSVALTTTFTPKSWSSGGNTAGDNWEIPSVQVVSARFIPLSATRLLKLVTTETHVRGGGVGKDKLQGKIGGRMISGSQFSYHPSGQSYTFDIITAVSTKAKVINLPSAGTTVWDGGSEP